MYIVASMNAGRPSHHTQGTSFPHDQQPPCLLMAMSLMVNSSSMTICLVLRVTLFRTCNIILHCLACYTKFVPRIILGVRRGGPKWGDGGGARTSTYVAWTIGGIMHFVPSQIPLLDPN